MFRKILKRLLSPLLKFWAERYTKSAHAYAFRGINLCILPTVFHPALHLSTHLLIDFLEKKEIKHKTLWELGAGNGLISLWAAQQGAIVTASDINEQALIGLKENALRNHLAIKVIKSDIFAEMKGFFFDYIIVNPPYYPKNAENDAEKAFFCGANFEYFYRFFEELASYFSLSPQKTAVYMILSEDCKIADIEAIGKKNGIEMSKIWEKRKWGEMNFIFQLIQKDFAIQKS